MVESKSSFWLDVVREEVTLLDRMSWVGLNMGKKIPPVLKRSVPFSWVAVWISFVCEVAIHIFVSEAISHLVFGVHHEFGIWDNDQSAWLSAMFRSHRWFVLLLS